MEDSGPFCCSSDGKNSRVPQWGSNTQAALWCPARECRPSGWCRYFLQAWDLLQNRDHIHMVKYIYLLSPWKPYVYMKNQEFMRFKIWNHVYGVKKKFTFWDKVFGQIFHKTIIGDISTEIISCREILKIYKCWKFINWTKYYTDGLNTFGCLTADVTEVKQPIYLPPSMQQ